MTTFCVFVGFRAQIADDALELAVGEGVDDWKRTGWPSDVADVSLSELVLVCISHSEVLRDLEQHRRLETGRHGLADVDLAIDDDAKTNERITT